MTGALQSTKHFVLHIFSPGELRNNFILLLTYNENSMATERRERGDTSKGEREQAKRERENLLAVWAAHIYILYR